MKLCVGAVSQRVVEEAASLQVHQIVASRRQVDVGGGYTGYDQRDLVNVVARLSGGATKVIRDHGGPLQGGTTDDGTDSFRYDIQAGFDGLHLDVCLLPKNEQKEALRDLIRMHGRSVPIEVGGEHDTQEWNDELLDVAISLGVQPTYQVVGAGTYVWADRQYGTLLGPVLQDLTRHARERGIGTKAHNMDFIGNRLRYDSMLDAYNIAPEFGMVEVRAVLTMLDHLDAMNLLVYAYLTDAWRRWFHADEGTWQDRAECALRYVLQDPMWQTMLKLNDEQEVFVRERIRDAIKCG